FTNRVRISATSSGACRRSDDTDLLDMSDDTITAPLDARHGEVWYCLPSVKELSAARRLARFVRALSLDAVPAPVVAAGSSLALDTVGNGLAAAREDFAGAVLSTAERLGGPPESTLIGGKGKVAAANAALANGTLAHGLDFDDTREDAIVHTGCVAVTTALAVGEAVGATGRAALEALITGVEVMCRIGLAVPGRFHA